jgi:hypothetical protein
MARTNFLLFFSLMTTANGVAITVDTNAAQKKLSPFVKEGRLAMHLIHRHIQRV